MALRNVLILRKPRSGCLEGRTARIQPIVNSFTTFFAGVTTETGVGGAFPLGLASPFRQDPG